ncbi:MAG TPA: regulatory protein RecX [Rhodanobacteraceae bacterium]|nr:regulatory protein RecX [Rhodanobacteraceae bacterium]
MLARREHSRRELRTRLDRSGYDEEESEAALRQLGEQHYQDDARFGEMLMRSRVAQGYGPARIHAELKSHGLSEADVRALLDTLDVDWIALAAAQLRRRYAGKAGTAATGRARRAQFLLRRGFAAATVRAVTDAETDP